MKKGICPLSVFLALALFCAGCTSTTLIESTPGKAKVFLEGKYVGETPYRHRDSRIEGSSMTVRLEKEGYETLERTITKDERVNVGAVVGGLFTIVPLLWSMEYLPVHSYDLQATIIEEKPVIQKRQTTSNSMVSRLRELKQLLDEKVLTPKEFEKEKAKVLDSEDE